MVRRLLLALPLLAMLAACQRTTAPTVTATQAREAAVTAAAPATTAEPTATDQAAKTVETIRLPMGYIPNIQYAPFYLADQNGYFQKAGFAIQYDYSFETNGVALVAAGEVPFAVVSGEQVLLARAQGLPVVYVMAWWQKFPVAVIADAKLGLKTPADLKGHTIGLPGLFGANYIGLVALLHHAGLSESDVTLESIGFNQVEAFTTGKNNIVVGYITNEPIQLRHQGFDLTVFPVADYVNLASNGIITSEKYLQEHPDRVRAFVGALLLGLRDTIEHPEAAYKASLKYVEDLKPDDPIQWEVLQTAINYWNAENLGYSRPEAWQNMHDTLLQMGLLEKPIDITKAFTNDYLPDWAKGWRK